MYNFINPCHPINSVKKEIKTSEIIIKQKVTWKLKPMSNYITCNQNNFPSQSKVIRLRYNKELYATYETLKIYILGQFVEG